MSECWSVGPGRPHDVWGGPFKQDFFIFLINTIVTPRRTKAWISISKEKGECPLHAPLALPAPPCTVLVTLVTPWAECRSGGPTKRSPCLSSQFTLMMTNTFVHGEGRWELQYASNHCPPEISLYSPPPIPPTYLSFSFLPFHLSHTFPLSLTFVNNPFPPFFLVHPSTQGWRWVPAKPAHSRRRCWFARGQCYLNRPIGLFAIAPSIRQEALRNQPITSISHNGIQWIYNGWSRARNEIRWEMEIEREGEDKEGEEKDGKEERGGERGAGLCQWPLCGESVLFVCGVKQTSNCDVRRWTVTVFDSKLRGYSQSCVLYMLVQCFYMHK